MYLRVTQRRNRDGSVVTDYGLAENVWNAETKRSEARVVHSFGRADRLDRAGLERLVKSINRVLNAEADAATAAVPPPATTGSIDPDELAFDRVYDYGVVLVARALWERLGIGPSIRAQVTGDGLTAPHEAALFAMTASRLEAPTSKLGCATRWLPDRAWLPEAADLTVHHLYRALDDLSDWMDDIETEVFSRTANLLNLDVDLIFYDTTTADFEIDDPDADEDTGDDEGPVSGPSRYGRNKEGRDDHPQVVIALAVTRDGMPVRSWVLPGNTADVATVQWVRDDLRAWQLGRSIVVGDAGIYAADTLKALSRGMGRSLVAVPMRKVKVIETEVLSRPGRYRQVAENLQVKEVVVGDGERRRRYLLCLNPVEADRQHRRREQTLADLKEELATLERGRDDHPPEHPVHT